MSINFLKILFAAGIFLVSCQNPADKTPDLLKKYKTTTLPIKMKGCFGNSHYLPLIHPDSLNAENEEGTVHYCTFKTNGDYYAAIDLGLADCALPILTTYDKDGKIIDRKSILIGHCGAGPGFSCEEFAMISEDYTIYTSDTISIAEPDTMCEDMPGTTLTYVLYKKGKLLNSGKIELTDTLSKILK